MNLTDMNLNEIQELLKDFPPFRAKQVFEWINKGKDIDDMVNVPKEIKAVLKSVPFGGIRLLNADAAFDSVTKYLCALDDGNVVECVLMKYEHGNTLCISSQVGCAMGCRFCASTIGGVERNLTAGEMFFTVALLNNMFLSGKQRGVTNVVIMGIGEPMMNLDNVIKFIGFLKDRLNISPRNITVSTCGLPKEIIKFTDANTGANLALSLHAPNDELRKELMPVSNRFTIKETLNAMDYFFKKSGRRILIEYILIKDINSGKNHALELCGLLKGLNNCHVNLIPYNEVKEREFKAPSKKEAQDFLNLLTENGVSATLRRELGDKDNAACGQLRKRHIERK